MTHHNTLDIDLYLRIAPELYLKRLIVGGLDRVFEINRNFRNEGISTQHNPEFTMLEFYQAYTDYRDLMDLTAELLRQVAIDATGSAVVDVPGHATRLRQHPALHDARGGCRVLEGRGETDAGTTCGIRDWLLAPLGRSTSPASCWWTFSSSASRRSSSSRRSFTTIRWRCSPLSKNKPDEPEMVERFEIYAAGMEIGNAFTELNDPQEQRRRFEMQLAMRERGDEEAHQMDEDYLRALSYGMPPTGGEGIGHRSPDDAADELEIDPRRDPVPAVAARRARSASPMAAEA